MNTAHFAEPVFLWLLPGAVVGVAALFWWSNRVKKQLARQFIGQRLLEHLTAGVSPLREKLRATLIVAAVALLFVALARPQWGFIWEEAHQKGLDIVVAIDTSRSMLAQDVRPDRIERAKLAAFDLMRLAKTDRLGLVAFAGTAFLQSPLTLDDEAFRQNVEALNVGIIPQGGTAISAAIRTAMGTFEKGNDNHKVLVLFTDGEDHDAEEETLAAAKDAADMGLVIFTVGVGTPEGELLRVTDDQGNASFIKDDDGNVVKSRLNQTLLQQIATATHGFYLPLQGASPMSTLYSRGIAPLPKSEVSTKLTRTYHERYHWPLALAILCLTFEALLPETSGKRRRQRMSKPEAAAVAAAVMALLCMAGAAQASPSSAFRDYEHGNYDSSLQEYSRLSDLKTNDYRLHYDAGAAAYHAKQLDTAEKQFKAALSAPSISSDLPAQEHTYYDLGNTLFHIGEPLDDADKKKERWEQAIDNYGRALKLNTNDIDALNNLAYVKQKLEELKKQQQKQQQDQKNQQNKDQNQQQQQQQQNQQQQQPNQQNQQQQAKNSQNQQDKSQQQKQQDQQNQQQQQQRQAQNGKKDQQQAQAKSNEQRSKGDQQQAEAAAAQAQMTPEQARQILDAQRDDEKALIFSPENQPVTTQSGKIKDW